MSESESITECPQCQGPVYDNRADKKNPNAPDFKCRDRTCNWVQWPPRDADAIVPPPAGEPACPRCGSRMYDNREGKRNPKAPDWKCRRYKSHACDGVIWPPRPGENAPSYAPPRSAAPRTPARQEAPPPMDAPPYTDADVPWDDDLPF